ncbi:MAG TPA: 7TM domain-containing protein [Candidatus Peribacteraceae bacterium]|nr:7TM domain-containing protein [Candidatus Peribacteraceae bacterium]
MQRFRILLGSLSVLAGVLLAASGASAQAVPTSAPPSSGSGSVQAVVTGPEDVAVGRTIVLDATVSKSSGSTIQYRWYVEGKLQPISETVEAVYTPEQPGILNFRLIVASTSATGATVTTQITHTVNVYSRKIVLIADSSVPQDKLQLHKQVAADAGVFLRVLQPSPTGSPLNDEEALSTLISEQVDSLAGANAIVLWTSGISGLQSLMRAVSNDQEMMTELPNQTIVQIADGSLQTLARIARGPYSVLRPQQIILTRKEALDPLLTAKSIDQFTQDLSQRDLEHLTINASTAGLRPWNLLSSLVNAMLTKGIPSQTVILLLVLPFIAMILAFLRQVVGITTFGLYTPSIIALSFLALGWKLGVFFLVFILVTGYATRAVMQRWRLLYIPKVAIILTVVSFTLLILMGLSTIYNVTFSRETVFILLIMSTLSESFLNLKTEEGWKSAIFGIVETTAAALICVFIVQWDVFQSLILAYPELILLTIIVDAILGKWTGLRLVEYFRFKEVFHHMQEEE